MKYKLICLGSTRAVGKDTFYNLLRELDENFTHFSFAAALKNKLNPICIDIFGKDIGELTAEEKELFRPLMIKTGKIARHVNKDFWVEKVAYLIESRLSMYPKMIPVICDMRYLNEYHYFKNIFKDNMLFVNIIRNGAPEPTDEEKIHGPELAKMADLTLTWETDSSLVSLRPLVADFYKNYLA